MQESWRPRSHPGWYRWCFLSGLTLYRQDIGATRTGKRGYLTGCITNLAAVAGLSRTRRSPAPRRLQNGAEVGKRVKIPCITFRRSP